jgi:lipopolysaccharide biosynthesis glycosyltransferase
MKTSSLDAFAELGPRDPIVACAADDGYAMPLAVAIRSVLEHLDPERRLGVVVLDGGIAPANRARLLRSWSPERTRVAWLEPDARVFEEIPTWRYLNRVAYYRLLLPELLPPELPKVLYLDSDLVVLSDLGPLWESELGDWLCLAVQDATSPYVDAERAMPNWRECVRYGFTVCPIANYVELGLAPDARYFNSGVLVMNLAGWREERVTAQLLECMREYGDHLHAADQYPLNVVLAGRWGELDPRWNVPTLVHGSSSWRMSHFDEATFRRVLGEPFVVHWAGPEKPWNGRGSVPLPDLFHRYRALTAWSGMRGRAVIASFHLRARLRGPAKSARRGWKGLTRAVRETGRWPRRAAARVRRRTR